MADKQIEQLLNEIKENNHKEVVVYSMSHCPACKELKQKLDHIGVYYENVEMEGNEEMWSKIKADGGADYVPQVRVSNKLIHEFDEINDLIGMVISEMVGRRIIIK